MSLLPLIASQYKERESVPESVNMLPNWVVELGEDEELSCHAQTLTGKVEKCFLTASSGQQLRLDGATAQAQLQLVSSKSNGKDKANELKGKIWQNSFSSAPPKERRCQRPSFGSAIRAFNEVTELGQLIKVAGGVLQQNFDKGNFINGCAARISYVLEQTGCTVPAIPGQTVSGKNGEQYIYRLDALEQFLTKAYGPPDLKWRYTSMTDANERVNLKGKKGILIERWEKGWLPITTCTGHAGLLEGDSTILLPRAGMFWELPDDAKEQKK